VECFASADSDVVLDPEMASSKHAFLPKSLPRVLMNYYYAVQTDQFQAMYRVLMSFALMNAALSKYKVLPSHTPHPRAHRFSL
jgi:hypothetical protein